MVTALILLALLLGLTGSYAGAQNETPTDEAPPAELEPAEDVPIPSILFITETDENSIPTVGLRVGGVSGSGRGLNPELDAFTIRHNGEIVIADETRAEPVGVLTIFLLDLTPGVESQIPAVQALIEQYAGADYMTEQTDYVAIYRAGEESAIQLLAPDTFHNSVRNFFVDPLETQAGPTALVDSLLALLDQVQDLKADPAMAASIVVVSDGTDPLSVGEPATVAPRAAQMGVPLHTVGLTNINLSDSLQASGHAYLASLAEGSRGSYSDLDDTESSANALAQITTLSDQWWLLYTVPDAAGGTFPVEVSLLHEPEVTAETSVTITGTTPSVSLNIPAESRQLSLPDLESPVVLSFSATVAWLDGVERAVQSAELLVNGQAVTEIDPTSLSNFETEVSNLSFGANTVQIRIVDAQGIEARSPAVTLSIAEGPQQIPTELAPSFPWGQYAVYCLVGLLIIAVVVGGVFFILERRGTLRVGPRRRQPAEEPPPPPAKGTPAAATEMHMHAAPIPPPIAADSMEPAAYLEVVQSESRLPARIPLTGSQIRLGRSPQQTDVAFEKDITVSRLHATITWDGEMYHIYDENSTSGTWVNDQQVIDYGLQLLDGDEIYLGKVTLRFHLPG